MIEINITDTISASLYKSEAEHSILIIASATGVKQSFYEKFARFIASTGISVITFDYEGIGRSLKQPIKQLKNNAQNWGSVDLESIINYTIKNYPNCKRYILGHSIGGQLIGLAKSAVKSDKIILIAAQTGYWKTWTGFQRIKMWGNWHILFPLAVRIFGYLPSKKISSMENLPKNVALQWSGWGKHRDYLFSDIPIEQTYYDKIDTDITAICIEDDDYAPKKAVDWMTKKYSAASVKEMLIRPKNYNTKKIGHFGIFKERFKDSLWKLLLDEMG